jgi:P27 family predicted phage terminase small subunit
MGRPRLPTSLKKLHGTARPDRANPREPKGIGAPEPAARLSAAAAAYWPRVMEVLAGMRVTAESDGLAVAALCETLADLAAARESLAKPVEADGRVIAEGGAQTYTVETKSGGVMVRARPEVGMIADADRRLMSWLAKFGLSPSDRTRVRALGGAAVPGAIQYEPAKPGRKTLDEYLAEGRPLGSELASDRRRRV